MSYTNLLIKNKYQAIVFIYIVIISLILYFYKPFQKHPHYDVSGNVQSYSIDVGRILLFFFIVMCGFIAILIFSNTLNNFLTFISEHKIKLTIFSYILTLILLIYFLFFSPQKIIDVDENSYKKSLELIKKIDELKVELELAKIELANAKIGGREIWEAKIKEIKSQIRHLTKEAEKDGIWTNVQLMKYYIQHNKLLIFFIIALLGFILLLFYTLTPRNFFPSNYFTNLLKLLLILFILFGIIFSTIYLLSYTPWPLTIIVSLLNIVNIIGFISLIVSIIFRNINFLNQIPRTPFGLFLLTLFYIPCSLINFINYLKKEVQNTTPTTWIIFFLELVTIGLRILLPKIYQQYTILVNPTEFLIEKGPIYLDKLSHVNVVQEHKTPKDSGEHELTPIFNYNYALSCWIWINPEPPSASSAYSKSVSILDYGEILQINYNKNKLELFAATTKNDSGIESLIKVYELEDIKFQKWNNIIFNYSGGTLDIFINNNLVSSSSNITPIMYYNNVTIGEDNGIAGGIKDIVYYDKVLSKQEIKHVYYKNK